MRSIKSICALLAVLAVGSFAHADTIYTFTNMTLTENKGAPKIYGTVTGEVTINSLGDVVSGDFVATYGATTPGGTPTHTYTFTDIFNPTALVGSSPRYYLTVFEDTTDSTWNTYIPAVSRRCALEIQTEAPEMVLVTRAILASNLFWPLLPATRT